MKLVARKNSSPVQVEPVLEFSETTHPLTDWIWDVGSSVGVLTQAGVPNYYWKISGNQVIEMDQAEKDMVDASRAMEAKQKRFNAVNERAAVHYEHLYKITKVHAGGKIDEVSFFLTDNGDGTYSDLVKKLMYHYDVDKSHLLSISQTLFNADGSEGATDTLVEFTTDGADVVSKTKSADVFKGII